MGKEISFNRIMIQENIRNGQKNEKGLLEYFANGNWYPIKDFTTIGYKRLFRFDLVSTSKIRISIIQASKGPVEIRNLGLYLASPLEK